MKEYLTPIVFSPITQVQLPRPLRPESILVYDSPTDTSVISWESPADQLSNSDHKWPMEVLPPIKRLPKRQAVPARLLVLFFFFCQLVKTTPTSCSIPPDHPARCF